MVCPAQISDSPCTRQSPVTLAAFPPWGISRDSAARGAVTSVAGGGAWASWGVFPHPPQRLRTDTLWTVRPTAHSTKKLIKFV